jgi:hypothetical protein
MQDWGAMSMGILTKQGSRWFESNGSGSSELFPQTGGLISHPKGPCKPCRRASRISGENDKCFQRINVSESFRSCTSR